MTSVLLTRRQVLGIVAAACLSLQVASASVQQRSFETPNSASLIARSLVADGEFQIVGRRAWQLPAEPLFLAAGFSVLPASLWPYLHVPVTTALVMAVTIAATTLGGPILGLVTGVLASLDPFVLIHGPVWDDAFLAAALEWAVFAAVIVAASRIPAAATPASLVGLAAVAATAAMTRTLAQVVLLAVAMALVSRPRLRPMRPLALAIAGGVLVAMCTWGTRNYAVLGSFLVGTTHDGESFFESNCAYTRQGIRELGLVGFQEACSPAQFAHASSLGELEANRQFRHYGLAYIAANPGDFAKTALFKIGVTLSGYDFAKPPESSRNVVALVASVATLAVGGLGLYRLSRGLPTGPLRSAWLAVVVPTAALTMMMLAVGPTGLRYRLTVSAALWIGCAVWVTQTIASLSKTATDTPTEDARAISI
jgi:hypothetical protein